MDVADQACRALSAILFLYYGLSCILSDGMVEEFERFGLSRYRRLTGSLEVLGAVGLLVGYLIPAVLIVASGGLTLLMLLGVAVRLRVRDPLIQALPALTLAIANSYVFVRAMGSIGAA